MSVFFLNQEMSPRICVLEQQVKKATDEASKELSLQCSPSEENGTKERKINTNRSLVKKKKKLQQSYFAK